MKKVKVVGKSKDDNRNIICKYDRRPMLNTMVYDVNFPDVSIRKYEANIISNNMYYQVDSEGFWYSILSDQCECYIKEKIVDTMIKPSKSPPSDLLGFIIVSTIFSLMKLSIFSLLCCSVSEFSSDILRGRIDRWGAIVAL